MNAAQVAAWAVHLYTATGVLLGLAALAAISSEAYGAAFAYMAVATLIDSTDGALARRFEVKRVLPHFDGARLDDIVDYFNYVIVPVVLVHRAELVPEGTIGLVVGCLPILASAYGFCQADAKTADHFFKGFPSYWNIVVFYLYALRAPLSFNVFVLVVLSIMVFVPIRYLYPSRTPRARRTTYVLGIGWAVMMLVLLVQLPQPSRLLTIISLFFPAYYFGMSFHLHFDSPSPVGSQSKDSP